MNQAKSSRITISAIMLISIAIGGCTMVPVQSLSTDESAAVQRKSNTVVLYRISGTDDGKPIATWETGWDRTFVRLSPIRITDPPPKYMRWHPTKAPSADSQRLGWQYMVLESGSYRIFLNTPYGTDGTWAGKDGDNRQPSFWLNVPGDEDIVYAGSLHVECTTTGGAHSCDNDVRINNEQEAAMALSRSSFPELAAPVRTPMSAYGRTLVSHDLKSLGPLKVNLVGEKDLRSPDWGARAHERYFEEPGSFFGGGCYGPGCGGLVLLALVYWPIASALTTSETKAAEKAWAPCMNRLSTGVQNIDLPRLLERAIEEEFRQQGIPLVLDETRTLPNAELKIEMQRVQFRQCQSEDEYCLEIAARVRVVDLPEEKLRYDATLTYTNDNAWYAIDENGIRSLQRTVSLRSPCSALQRYCEADGSRLLEDELRRGIKAIVEELFNSNGKS